ncbi:DASH complex subunit DAD2 [Lodderomyces elongisporus NRRL YB-4239]|uniref:DASH complex subunit DAD2 n=1 Tax=Lodderomyces elongisporus (strain ATCC 11503 / CBS 2605 / JCM 1781 / NBRC 1676 / NRRL YB-4239) TaxID=379508 RepID=A5DTE2_LODEL|nr:DASH complex subunit DAD2 [Lodderomyces elongisporus NRRL YB-4239]
MLKLNTAIYQKIAEKRSNLDQLREFRSLADDLVNELENIGEDLGRMKGGTASIASIVANWQNVIQSISLASIGLMRLVNENAANEEEKEEMEVEGKDGEKPKLKLKEIVQYPEPLVRIKLEQERDFGEAKSNEKDVEEENEDNIHEN